MNKTETLERYRKTLTIRRLAPRTIRIYNRWIEIFIDYINFTDSENVTLSQAQDFLYFLQSKNYAARTHNQAVYALRQFFEAVLERPVTPRQIPKVHPPRSDKPWLNADQARQILDSCSSPRLKAAVALAFGCGLRLSEITHLQFKNINKTSCTITIENSKWDRTRTVPYSPQVREILNDYVRSLGSRKFKPDDFLFYEKKPEIRLKNTSLAMEFHELIQTFDFYLPGHSLHSLRHAYATELSMHHVPLPVIQKLMGHVSAVTTAKYIHSPQEVTSALPDLLESGGSNANAVTSDTK
ncbi:MAG: tyrosine-type recombinase/integrase [Erysipelotrichaceae bacterium]|nr:tyrosine-type recombinase/integrase [Erysipelotrichaceae bacterium]